MSVTIKGVAQERQTLAAAPVTSSGDAVVKYQWQSSVNGTSWTNIAGATLPNYAVNEAGDSTAAPGSKSRNGHHAS